MKTFTWKMVSIAIIAVIIMTTNGVRPTYAGSNGQQLAVAVAPGAQGISVTGRNQNGNQATWTYNGPAAHGVWSWGTYWTTRWWWVGTVTITVRYSDGSKATCRYVVPKSQRSDWYSVSCV